MYKEFFGLDDTPFTLTPDPRFIVFTPSYNEVLASLYYGLENAKGLVVLTGEVGTGKTTALRWILRRLDASVLAAYVFNPRLSIDEFYQHVTEMLGIKDWANKSDLLNILGKVLEERHKRGLRTVIIIDEAHELSDYVLEEIRLLTNFESDNAKHLQIVLTGQPELREKLNQQNLRQLKQRVALRCNMHAFPSVEEVDRYITERLLIAGAKQPNIFTPGAVDFIYQCSEGIPRQINNICDNAMLAAYSAGEQVIGRQIIEQVAENLDMLPRKDSLIAADAAQDDVPASRTMRPETRDEIWEGQARTDAVKPRVFTSEPPSAAGYAPGHNDPANTYTNGHSNGYENGHAEPHEDGQAHPYSNGHATPYKNGYSNGAQSGYERPQPDPQNGRTRPSVKGRPNGYEERRGLVFDDLEEEVRLEIEDLVGPYRFRN